MIKRIISYGTTLAAGVVAGVLIKAPRRCDEQDKPDIWRGEEEEITYEIETAEQQIEWITEELESDEAFDKYFAEEDLKDVRAKLSHGISDAKNEGERKFQITVYDRQKLRIYELIMNRSMVVHDEP